MSARLDLASGAGSKRGERRDVQPSSAHRADHAFFKRGRVRRGAETVDIDPSGRVERAPALFLPDELARIVVGVEGSALAHADAVLDPGACVFAIQSPASFNTIHRLATADAGLRFAFPGGEIAEGDDFTMPIKRPLRAIDMVEAALR